MLEWTQARNPTQSQSTTTRMDQKQKQEKPMDRLTPLRLELYVIGRVPPEHADLRRKADA